MCASVETPSVPGAPSYRGVRVLPCCVGRETTTPFSFASAWHRPLTPRRVALLVTMIYCGCERRLAKATLTGFMTSRCVRRAQSLQLPRRVTTHSRSGGAQQPMPSRPSTRAVGASGSPPTPRPSQYLSAMTVLLRGCSFSHSSRHCKSSSLYRAPARPRSDAHPSSVPATRRRVQTRRYMRRRR